MNFWAPNQTAVQDHQYNTKGEITTLIHEKLDLLGCSHLKDQIKIEWNSRFTRRLADANYTKRRIRLSITLWPRATPTERLNTVIHEVCHLTARQKYGYYYADGSKIKPHGREWQQEMRKCGLNPKEEVYHNIDRTGLRRKNRRVMMYCGCGEHPISSNRHTRMQRGNRYHCTRCKCTIKASPYG